MASPVYIQQNDSKQNMQNSWKMACLATFLGLNAALALLICASGISATDKNARPLFQGWQTQEFANDCSDPIIGQNVTIGSRVRIGCGAQIGSNVKIGNDVEIGPTVMIGDRSVILNGVKLFESSLGPSALVACNFDGKPCNVTLKNCVVEREAMVFNMGVLENKRFRRQTTQIRERRAVDRSDCRGKITDVSQCCRTTNAKVMNYKNCKDTTKKTYVPVLTHTSKCTTSNCKTTNVNTARSAAGSCSSSLNEVDFAFGLQKVLAPRSNYYVTQHQCMANTVMMQSSRARREPQGKAPMRQRRQADVPVDGIANQIDVVDESTLGSSTVTGFYFNQAGLASLSPSLVDPTSETYQYLGSQMSYWTEVQDNVFPTIESTVVIAVVLSVDEGQLFDFDLWSQGFMDANPGFSPVHYFNHTTCSKIITMKAPSINESPADRVNLVFEALGKVETVVYHNVTQNANGSQAFTGCLRVNPDTLMLPNLEDPMEFECIADGNNVVLGGCLGPVVEPTPVLDSTVEELGMD